MARRTLNHKALCADFEAAERKKQDAAGEGAGPTEGVEAGADDVAAGEEAPKKSASRRPSRRPSRNARALPNWCASG